MRFILHVGPHKTGTTYIQNQFTSYRKILLDYGIYYPTEWTNAGNAPWCHVDLVKQLEAQDFDAIGATLAAVRERGCRDVLLSCEGLSGIKPEALARFRDAIGEGIEIAIFLRRWTSLIASNAQEDIRQGAFTTLPEFCLEHFKRPLHSHILNHNLCIEKFVGVFGEAAVRLYSFDNIVAAGDLFSFFAKSLFKLDLRPIEEASFRHPSMSPELIELVRALGMMARLTSSVVPLQPNRIAGVLQKLDLADLVGRLAPYRRDIRIDEYLPPFEQIYRETFARYGKLVTPLNPGGERDALFRRGEAALIYVSPDYLLDLGLHETLRSLFARVSAELAAQAAREGTYPASPAPAPPRTAAKVPEQLLYGFGRSSANREIFENGWSISERDETWAIGTESSLVLPKPRDDQDCPFTLRFRGFIVPGKHTMQRVRVLANGVAVGEFSVETEAAVTKAGVIPREALAGFDRLRLVFQTPDAAFPGSFGLPDKRQLSIAVKQLVFGAAPGATPAAPTAIPAAPMPAPPPEPAPRPFHGDVFAAFESLGENCEFGLAQRRAGIEPLGLLRFASTPFGPLLRALRGRFAGMGEADSIEVEVAASGREYMVFDRRYHIRYHAWVKVGEMAPEAIRVREQRRVPLLANKLIEDLTEGDKIFVFHGMTPLTDAQARDLAEAVRSYGPGVLLWVELADAAHPAGSVERRGPALLKGYMDRFAPGENAHDFSFDGWLGLCRNALAAVRAAEPVS